MRTRLPDDLEARSAPKAKPNSDADRYRVCPVCQQTFDSRSLDEAYHHSAEPHEPYSGSRYAQPDRESRGSD